MDVMTDEEVNEILDTLDQLLDPLDQSAKPSPDIESGDALRRRSNCRQKSAGGGAGRRSAPPCRSHTLMVRCWCNDGHNEGTTTDE